MKIGRLIVDAIAPKIRKLIWLMAGIAGGALIVMIAVTVADITLRRFGMSFMGAYDLVGIAGALAVAGALPLTKAVKGHVAIEYFYHKSRRSIRFFMDTASRLFMLVFFCFMAYCCMEYGEMFRRTNEVTPTLYIPIFWVPWILALSSLLTAFVTLYHLLHPGRPMMRIHGENKQEAGHDAH